MSRLHRASQFDPNIPSGDLVEAPTMPCEKYRCENLEEQTFHDEFFDLVITQDVFEHVFHPDLAIREIARTLRPGGRVITISCV
ncbi:MAG: class I SAM-dependent methyltransferase [Gammaproteobacteria bacterium]